MEMDIDIGKRSSAERKFMSWANYTVDFLYAMTLREKTKALEYIKGRGETTDTVAKEILRVAKDEIVVKAIRIRGSAYLNEFVFSIREAFRIFYIKAQEEFIIKELPKTVNQAITLNRAYYIYKVNGWDSYSFGQFASKLNHLFKIGRVDRKKCGNTYSYWQEIKKARVRRTEGEKTTKFVLANMPLSKQKAKNEDNRALTKKECDNVLGTAPSNSQQELLVRIKTVEDDNVRIEKRIVKLQELFEMRKSEVETRKLEAKLKKAEVARDANQETLDALEKNFKRWSMEEANIRVGLLR